MFNLLKKDLSIPSFLGKHLSIFSNTKNISGLSKIWFELAKKYPDSVILNDEYSKLTLTTSDFVRLFSTCAAALQKLGIKKGMKVAQFSENSAKWIVLDQAIMACGAINAVRGSEAPKSELQYIYEHSDSVALVTDDIKVIEALSPLFAKKQPKFIIYIGKNDISGLKNIIKIPFYSFEDFVKYAEDKKFWPTTIEINDPATIVYSSGTTGKPKGIVLSHGNLLSQFAPIHTVLKVKKGRHFLSILPIWHMYERLCEYYAMSKCAIIDYTNLRNFKKDLIRFKPQYLISVPRLWVLLYDGIMAEIASKPLISRMIFNFLLKISKICKKTKRIISNRSIYHEKTTILGKIIPFFVTNILMPIDKFSMKFVYKKIKDALGGKFIKGISGGGALPHYIEDFFEAVGVALYVGYGLTETSPVLSVRKEENNKLYSVGPALPGTDFKIVDPTTFEEKPQGQKGLILARGPQVMLGYYKDKEATEKVTYEDWFITGDIGWLTKDANLVITGRMKEIIVLSNGENIEADGIEAVCLELPYVSQIVVTGQDKPNLTALIVLNQDEFCKVMPKKANKDPNTLTDFKAFLLNEINNKIKSRVNFRPFERINDITFIKEEFTVDNGMMTQSLKIKKHVVCERYSQEIEAMYKK